jgi:hypothetical protein
MGGELAMSIKDRARTLVDQKGDLARRVGLLEEAMDESRRLNERLSDLLDLAVELLLPEDRRNDERLDRILDRLDPGAGQPAVQRGSDDG